jgi:hypothetical protein
LKLLRRTITIAAVAALGLFPNLALATPDQVDPDDAIGNLTDGVADSKKEVYDEGGHQHGSASGHLEPTQENVDLVSKLRLTRRPDKISDVAVLGDFAYLGEWAAGLTHSNCRGGVYVVDISDPTNPKKVKFLASHAQTYATEGVQALHVDTPTFTGDLLVVSNEACGPRGIGGFTLYDITDPSNAKLLSEHGGDYTEGDTFGVVTGFDPVAHEAHSAFAWEDQGANNVYLVAIDNNEGLDLDFFNITDPRNPFIVSETGLEEWPTVNVNAFGDFPTSHDFDVRFFGDHWYALISYWDAGWVLLNVDNPATPILIDDTEYPPCDQFIGAPGSDVDPRSCPPEGNGHQAEWNEAGNLFLGTDEDSSPYRLLPITVTENTVGGAAVTPQPPPGTEYEGGEFGWTVPLKNLPDGVLNGPVIWGGYGCDEDNLIPPASDLDAFTAPGEEQIVVLQRGPVSDSGEPYEACLFSIKIENAQDAGYDAAIIANHHVGSAFGDEPDSFFCGGQGHTFTITAHGLCSGHRSMHELFGSVPNYGTSSATPGYPEADMNGKIGGVGPKIETSSFFDGWGYVSLYEIDNTTGATSLVEAYAIDEQIDEDFAIGFGDLTVHEVATGVGPDAGLAYFSWYSGGFRVAEFDGSGIEEVGRFIDEGGNDFWGVQLTDQFIDGNRVVALSDRDFGLYLFTYTG